MDRPVQCVSWSFVDPVLVAVLAGNPGALPVVWCAALAEVTPGFIQRYLELYAMSPHKELLSKLVAVVRSVGAGLYRGGCSCR
jgi:hypothetical protein